MVLNFATEYCKSKHLFIKQIIYFSVPIGTQSERDRLKENARLVKSIIKIKKRETNHGNTLVQHKDGHNIYTLCGNSRSHIMS
jgi:hypothetical protein